MNNLEFKFEHIQTTTQPKFGGIRVVATYTVDTWSDVAKKNTYTLHAELRGVEVNEPEFCTFKVVAHTNNEDTLTAENLLDSIGWYYTHEPEFEITNNS